MVDQCVLEFTDISIYGNDMISCVIDSGQENVITIRNVTMTNSYAAYGIYSNANLRMTMNDVIIDNSNTSRSFVFGHNLNVTMTNVQFLSAFTTEIGQTLIVETTDSAITADGIVVFDTTDYGYMFYVTNTNITINDVTLQLSEIGEMISGNTGSHVTMTNMNVTNSTMGNQIFNFYESDASISGFYMLGGECYNAPIIIGVNARVTVSGLTLVEPIIQSWIAGQNGATFFVSDAKMTGIESTQSIVGMTQGSVATFTGIQIQVKTGDVKKLF